MQTTLFLHRKFYNQTQTADVTAAQYSWPKFISEVIQTPMWKQTVTLAEVYSFGEFFSKRKQNKVEDGRKEPLTYTAEFHRLHVLVTFHRWGIRDTA